MTRDDQRRANIEQFAASAQLYDDCRPRPPGAVVRLLTDLSLVHRPALVVDLGCGTGLSTRIWAGRADRVIGIEPGDAMRRVAEQRTGHASISYRRGFAEATGLPDGEADIVTASQAFHWMEPEASLAEVARILRPGGVFATLDCRWPVTVHWEAESAELGLIGRVLAACKAHGVPQSVGWPKSGHLDRMKASGLFRFCKAVTMHHREAGDAQRFLGLCLSQGHVQKALQAGIGAEELGFPEFVAEVERVLKDATWPWHVSYDIRYGIR